MTLIRACWFWGGSANVFAYYLCQIKPICCWNHYGQHLSKLRTRCKEVTSEIGRGIRDLPVANRDFELKWRGGGGGCFAWPEGFSSFFDSSTFTHNKGARPLDFISALLSRSDSSEKDRHYFDSLESTSISGTDMLPPELSAHWVLFRSRKNVCYFENARAEIFFFLFAALFAIPTLTLLLHWPLRLRYTC